jgi:hypothetical protein
MSRELLESVEAHMAGRATRSALVRHRRLLKDPMVVCLFQLGGEPFTVAALAWGRSSSRKRLAVAGDPRNHELVTTALKGFARDFNKYFETPWHSANEYEDSKGRIRRDVEALPQVVVPNRQTVALLGRIGRRFRFDGADRTPPELIAAASHLAFLREHAAIVGQQLILPIDDLIAGHWTVPLNAAERANVAAADAYVHPPKGLSGYDAAVLAERSPIGPRPDADQDSRLEPLLDRFNDALKRRVSTKRISALRAPIQAHYEELLEPAWTLIWRNIVAEREYDEARFVETRLKRDELAYAQHMRETDLGIRRRARRSVPQAIEHVRQISDVAPVVTVQEAADDPLKMVDLVLNGTAILGEVIAVEPDRTEQGPVNRVRRPLIRIRSAHEITLSEGDRVRRDIDPNARYEIRTLSAERGHELVDVVRLSRDGELPDVGDEACFFAGSIEPYYALPVSRDVPWTHAVPPTSDDDDEADGA